jgi:hypothetical protein
VDGTEETAASRELSGYCVATYWAVLGRSGIDTSQTPSLRTVSEVDDKLTGVVERTRASVRYSLGTGPAG